MNHPKQRMKTELNNLIQRYRIENHLSYDRAVRDVIEEAVRLEGCSGKRLTLRTSSEWQSTLNRASTKRSFMGSLKRALGWWE